MMNALRTHAHVREYARASLRPFLVRWTDEDRGPQSIAVLGVDKEDARETIEDVTGQVVSEVVSL